MSADPNIVPEHYTGKTHVISGFPIHEIDPPEYVGREDYRHEAGACYRDWVKPGNDVIRSCGDPRCIKAGGFAENVPEALKTAALRIVHAYAIGGICDPMYIANVIAKELGMGDGLSNFDA